MGGAARVGRARWRDPVFARGAVVAGASGIVEHLAGRIEFAAAVPAAGVHGGGAGEASRVPGTGAERES